MMGSSKKSSYFNKACSIQALPTTLSYTMCGHRSLESQDCQAMKEYLLTPTLFQQQVGTSRQLSTGVGENPEKGMEAAAPSNIKEM